MNIMTFPWSPGADCRSFTAWFLNFTGPYLPTSPIRDSCSNLSLTKKSVHLVVGCAMIHGNQRYPRASLQARRVPAVFPFRDDEWSHMWCPDPLPSPINLK